MKFTDIINTLASGELANLYIADDHLTIKPDKLDIVIRTVNAGLIDLHSRFLLKKNKVSIVYELVKKNYEILEDDFIEVLWLSQDNKQVEYYLQQPNMLSITSALQDNTQVDIYYKAKCKLIDNKDNLNNLIVDLPLIYLNALTLFVASKLYASIPNQLDGDLQEGHRYYQRYLEEIRHLTNQGVDVDGLDENKLFVVRGFV